MKKPKPPEPTVPFPIIEIYARDWSEEEGPIDVDHVFKLYYAHIVGYLLREDADSLVIGSELFGKMARNVQTIPKETVVVRRTLRGMTDDPIPAK